MDERPRRPSGVLSPPPPSSFFHACNLYSFSWWWFRARRLRAEGIHTLPYASGPRDPPIHSTHPPMLHAPSFRFARGMGFDPPRYLRGGLVHCAGIGLINKILGQLRFQWKTRVVEGDVDGAIAEIFCSMCVFHSGNLFLSPQAIRRAPRRAASDDPKHRVRKQANSIKRSIKRGAR